MKLVKYLLTTAAITAVTAAMGVSTSAATLETSGDFTVTVDEATKRVSLSDIGTINGDQMTMLILNNDATTVTEGDIEQIDQDATATSWANIAMNDIEVGKEYIVRIGGDGSIKTAKFKLVEDAPTVDKWGIGNVDLSGTPYQEDLDEAVGYVDISDAILLLYYLDGSDESKFTDEILEYANKLGDVDGNITDYENEYPDVTDVLGLLQFLEGEATERNGHMVNYYYPEG